MATKVVLNFPSLQPPEAFLTEFLHPALGAGTAGGGRRYWGLGQSWCRHVILPLKGLHNHLKASLLLSEIMLNTTERGKRHALADGLLTNLFIWLIFYKTRLDVGRWQGVHMQIRKGNGKGYLQGGAKVRSEGGTIFALLCSKQTLFAFLFLCFPPPPLTPPATPISSLTLLFFIVSEMSTAAGHNVADFLPLVTLMLRVTEYVCMYWIIGQSCLGPDIWN